MLLSQTCRYGLRAVLYLAAQDAQDQNYVSISTISRDLNISFHFLTKILQQLTHAGILTSYRGPGGGVSLAKSPSELTLYDIVVTLEGPELLSACVLGLDTCSDEKPCPLHVKWTKSREQLHKLFSSTDLDKLAKRIHRANLRLTD